MRTRVAMILTMAAILAGGEALAYESDGHAYTLHCTSDGYVLTSENPVIRATGTGADMRQVTGIENLYLGKSCDAFHKVFGTGKWCWANGGFVAEFPGHKFGFGRQELYCEPEPAWSGRCQC